MFGRRGIWGGLLLTVLVLVLVGGAAFMAYQAGFANGAIAEGTILGESLDPGEGNKLHYRGFYPLGGFGFGRLLFGFFFLLLFFGVLKRLLFFPFWMRYAGRRGMKGWKGGPWHEHWEDDDEEVDDDASSSKKKRKENLIPTAHNDPEICILSGSLLLNFWK